MPQEQKKKAGRPALGFTEPVMTRVSPDVKDWLSALVRASGLREGDLVRRVLDDARTKRWSPT